MKKQIRVMFKFGTFCNCIKITPCIQISHSMYFNSADGFGVELHWLKWGVGLRFWNDMNRTY